LYVTDPSEGASSAAIFQKLLPLHKKKIFDRIVFVMPASSKGRVGDLPDPGIPFTTKTIESFSYQGVVAIAREEQVSCIVIDLDRDACATPLRNLARKSPLPVLVVDRNATEGGLLDHVIFATDWSPASGKAMERVLALGELINELDIIHVISEKLTVKDMRELKERLEHTRKVCLNEGINAESHIYAGDVAEEIVTASEDYRGSIIIMGSGTEKTLWQRLCKRSTVCSVIQQAAAPVLFVPVAAGDH
jgi:nucleotide-binding universal stress UspA family protein